MKNKLLLSLSFAILLPAMVGATTLNVTASDTPGGGLYNYSYTFSVTGGSVDNIYLGSADLSPLSLNLLFDNSATTAWSWLGNNTPQDYLQFFTTNSSLLTPGDSLKVTFTSAFAPSASNFAIALNSGTGDTTATVTGVLAPGAVPEPGSIGLELLAGALLCSGAFIRRRMRQPKV